MAVATLNQNYHYGHITSYNWQYFDGGNYTPNIPQDDNFSSLLRDAVDPSLLDGSCYDFEPTDTVLDPAIQELILQSESPVSSMLNFENPEAFMIKQEEVDSDNESVMLQHEDLDFLDRDRSVDSEDSNCYGNSPRSSTDSGYNDESNIPRFDCIYESKLCISNEVFYEDDDIDSKPYCKSNRGAKKNLLWKFILETLKDKNQKLISWQDEREGTFKFDDTVAFSRRWGAKKGKNDMNFEKLSRAIRHYYKNGLMSRISTERLVYKFNWKSVPIRYRRY
ncbi:hypothetical protein LOTGIDRAFT_172065 [Lottia gigantea]|uniref:ETS domain-containing protein n=1 Tax=Lottia gigantea TaxID=225164 RepID=V4B9Y5_LOTGI|nr:hypothetical protein LOTGIDRAFT_172065 [Lottia gigantea]ESP02407.1 hypothetical protein LOTGIDRAFT_172065 [Lottia gigantea]